VVNARNVYGGTAKPQVEDAIGRAETALAGTSAWVAEYLERSK
ncbi:putative argininosuccinate lyase, partial [Paenibacillus agaridevorans]